MLPAKETPVSALIHAATMVAAGVYLLCRTFFLIGLSANVLFIIAVIGTLTAFLAALLAVIQNDIKKILAYSTISQLGYMVMALGLGSSTIAMFHLTTHAFFKALLFLGAGALIHSLGSQNIWKMGGAIRSMPITSITFLIGALALCGIWPLSGFFSKDEILSLAWNKEPLLFTFGVLTAFLTAFYMTRLSWLALLRPSRIHKAHEAPLIMQVPLILLAFFSIIGGFMGISHFLNLGEVHSSHAGTAFVPLIATAAALSGLSVGTLMYARLRKNVDPLKRIPAFIYGILKNKYYLDELFNEMADVFQKTLASLFSLFDRFIIIQIGVNGFAHLTSKVGHYLRLFQTGKIQNYVLFFLSGILVMVFFVVVKELL